MRHSPVLIAELLDLLTNQDRPASTRTLSLHATKRMRRLVAQRVVSEDEVMTKNAVHGYHEVTGATVSAILAKTPGVVMTGIAAPREGGRKQKHWALTTHAERWAEQRERREEALAAANTRFVVQARPDRGYVWVVDTSRVGKVNTPAETAVATFNTNVVDVEVATDVAERVRRALIRAGAGR
jgi:hypothetical protein